MQLRCCHTRLWYSQAAVCHPFTFGNGSCWLAGKQGQMHNSACAPAISQLHVLDLANVKKVWN